MPIAVIIGVYSVLYNEVQPKFDGFFELLPAFPFVLQVSLLLLVIGGLIGMWEVHYPSVNSYENKDRFLT